MFNNISNCNYRTILTFKLFIVKIVFSMFYIMFQNLLQNYRFRFFLKLIYYSKCILFIIL